MASARRNSDSPPHLYEIYREEFEENLHVHNPTRDLVLQRRREQARINIAFYQQLSYHKQLHEAFRREWDQIQKLPVPHEMKQAYRTRLITTYKSKIHFVCPPPTDK